MTKTITTHDEKGFDWIDITAPERDDIQRVAERFGLREASIEDSLQPDHLPKFEKLRDYSFVIMRMYAVGRES
ncbi:MAG: magnesium transporter CorA, partial [Sphingobacteriales bacterium]